MCGRFSRSRPAKDVADLFSLPLEEYPDYLQPRYNVAPRQSVPAVGLKADGVTRGIAAFNWGFVPRWAKEPNKGPRPINAMVETVSTNAAFRQSFRDRRCLVPADGFYEWREEDGKKVGYHFHLKDGGLFALAGVWDLWGKDKSSLFTLAVITGRPNELVAEVHDRMPVILPRERFDEWLDPRASVDDLLSLLSTPYPAEKMAVTRVGPAVNKVANDGPECMASTE